MYSPRDILPEPGQEVEIVYLLGISNRPQRLKTTYLGNGIFEIQKEIDYLKVIGWVEID